MADQGFVDFYELLQISPKAETETIDRIYKMLAARYHPDHPETGNLDLFLMLGQAHETLASSERRADYDILYQQHLGEPIGVFTTKEFAAGIDGEANRRLGILC